MKIIIDADACPKGVLQSCFELGHKFAVPVWTVASFHHDIRSDQHIVVENHAQAADIKIMNIAEAGDLVITQDWGLAAMVLGRKAKCISPSGQEYPGDHIGFLLEAREMKAKYRRSGGRTKGPKKRTQQDDAVFATRLEGLIKGMLASIETSEE